MTKYTPLSLHDFSPKKEERLFEILYYCSPFRGAAKGKIATFCTTIRYDTKNKSPSNLLGILFVYQH
jgi:hypothetical protein